MKKIIKIILDLVQVVVYALPKLPHFIINHFVNHQNKNRTFIQQYTTVWFAMLIIWFCLTLYCYKIDQEVLYALKYNSSHNPTSSWKEASFQAALIQFLLLICGGSFFKNLIYGDFIGKFSWRKSIPIPKIRLNAPHAIQLIILGALFAYGFHWTLSLSYKTGALAKVEAQGQVDALTSNYKEKSSTLQLQHDKKVANYRADAQAQIASIEANYQAQIASISNKYDAIIDQYKARYKQGEITKAKLEKRSSGFKAKKETDLAPLLEAKGKKIEAIQENLTAQLSAATSLYKKGKTVLDHQDSKAHLQVNQQIEETAQTTQGRNAQLNFLNQLIWVALLIFAYSAKQTQPTPSTHTRKPKKKKKAPTYTGVGSSVGSTATGSHTDAEEPARQPTTNVHDSTQADSWPIYRWPRSGEKLLEFSRNGYQLQATPRTIKVLYKGKYESLGTVKSWAKKYEKQSLTESEKYQEYCAMIEVMEVVKKELDDREPFQRAVKLGVV